MTIKASQGRCLALQGCTWLAQLVSQWFLANALVWIDSALSLHGCCIALHCLSSLFVWHGFHIDFTVVLSALCRFALVCISPQGEIGWQ